MSEPAFAFLTDGGQIYLQVPVDDWLGKRCACHHGLDRETALRLFEELARVIGRTEPPSHSWGIRGLDLEELCSYPSDAIERYTEDVGVSEWPLGIKVRRFRPMPVAIDPDALAADLSAWLTGHLIEHSDAPKEVSQSEAFGRAIRVFAGLSLDLYRSYWAEEDGYFESFDLLEWVGDDWELSQRDDVAAWIEKMAEGGAA